MNFLNQLFGGMTQIWLNVAFIVCVFGVVMFKPERIHNLSLFRIACLLFALSIIAPSLGMFLLSTATETVGSARRNPFGEITLSIKIVNLLAPLLFAGAFLAAISSLVPTSIANSTAPQDGK